MKIGNYELIKQIGEGGFGRTYKARHIYLDEFACLKQNINITDSDAKLLKNEAKLLWNIQHYSLPGMRDFFRANDGSYIMAMSFIEGKNLEDAVKKHKSIHPEDVCWLSQRVLNALSYLHHHGIIHGDVKPPNIIVQPKVHNAVLVDYGLASLRPTRKTKPEGYTPVFAAPEITEGKPPIPQSDLYSLGLTMIYALGGNPIAKEYPSHVPKKLMGYIDDLVKYNPNDRTSWEKEDLIRKLSDVRYDIFGRRSTVE
ncbi:MAG: serine/threonine protein kinase [Candidatus Woesearchaeota archaeon]